MLKLALVVLVLTLGGCISINLQKAEGQNQQTPATQPAEPAR